VSDEYGVPTLAEVVQKHHEWAARADARMPIGFPVFDNRTGGAAPGEVIMFLAYSGVGKTVFACNVAWHCRRYPTVFFSMEMADFNIARRLAAIHLDVPTRRIENEERQGDHSALDQLVRDFPHLTIYDEPGIGLREMSRVIENVPFQPRLVIIDYLELVKAPSMTAVEGIDAVTRKLRGWARTHDCTVLVLHQLNRAGGGGWEPVKRSDARYGGDFAADYTIGAYKPSLSPDAGMQDDLIVLQFLKTRTDGGLDPIGEAHHWNSETLRITPFRR
jgi:replicative DNA helicase